MKPVRHIAGPLENLVQRCVICGQIISDYTNAMWPQGQESPKGFPEGEVFITWGNPMIFTRHEDIFIDCKP